jgi:very-short-patch-repair endonuclease
MRCSPDERTGSTTTSLPHPCPLSTSGEGTGERGTSEPGVRATRRRSATPAEAALWGALRGRQLAGAKFRRQHPRGRFILDFYCAEAHLVIEVDGGVHDEPDQAAYDRVRTEHLVAGGLRVMRVTNREVLTDLAGVLRRIAGELATA